MEVNVRFAPVVPIPNHSLFHAPCSVLDIYCILQILRLVAQMEQRLDSLWRDLLERDGDYYRGSDENGCHRRDRCSFEARCVSRTQTKTALEGDESEEELSAVAPMVVVVHAPNAEPMSIEVVL